MTVREYIGARYVPLYIGEWDNSVSYEPLSIVQYQGNSYTSRQFVPIGIEITNTAYWTLTGNYNAQVEQYRQEVLTFDDRITTNATNIGNETTARENADTALGTRIDNEITARENADTALGTRIDNEITARENADTALGARIDEIESEMMVSVKDFGAIGDGVTDDTQAIQDAIDSLKDVYFPTANNEQYLVTDTLTTAREGQSFFMERYANTGILFDVADTTTPLFRVDHELARFVDMHIRAITRNTGIGIQAEAPNAFADGVFTNNTDVTLIGCDISNFYKGIVTNSRGPWVTDCTFSLLSTAIEIYWNNQSTNIGTPVGQILYGNAYGMRGIQIIDNRFHVITLNCIHITSGNPTGMIIDSNRFDVGNGRFLYTESSVVVKNSEISNNTILYPNVQAINLQGGINDSVIEGNTFMGFPPVSEMGSRTTAGILLHLHDCERVSVSNNTFMYCREDAIRIESGVCVTVCENTFRHIGIEASDGNIRGCVFVNTDASRLIFSNNVGTLENAYGVLIHSRSAVNFNRCFINNNAIIGTVINNYTDGGQNTFQTALT